MVRRLLRERHSGLQSAFDRPALPSGKGYADIAFLPCPGQSVPAIVVELKAEESASIALDQIRCRKYPEALRGYAGEMVLVGINYRTDPANPGYKHHTCVIECWA